MNVISNWFDSTQIGGAGSDLAPPPGLLIRDWTELEDMRNA